MENKMTVNGKEVVDYALVIEGAKGEDSHIAWAKFADGTELTEAELFLFEEDYLTDLVYG